MVDHDARPGGSETARDFDVEFRQDGDRLRACITGPTGTLETVVASWHWIARESARRGVSTLLVVDESTGDPLPVEELDLFLARLDGLGLDRLRVAYVGADASRVAHNEATEILARELGFRVRVFGIETEAALWLRHGER